MPVNPSTPCAVARGAAARSKMPGSKASAPREPKATAHPCCSEVRNLRAFAAASGPSSLVLRPETGFTALALPKLAVLAS